MNQENDQRVFIQRYRKEKSSLRNIIEWVLVYVASFLIWFIIFSIMAYYQYLKSGKIYQPPMFFITATSAIIGFCMFGAILTSHIFMHKSKRGIVYFTNPERDKLAIQKKNK